MKINTILKSISRKIGCFFLLTFLSLISFSAGAILPHQILVDPENKAWLIKAGGRPYFIAGPGDPEDFLYRGKLNPDGTRDGDQDVILEKLKKTGAKSIYFQAIRSHGGDGDFTHNPFVNHNPKNGINNNILDQWETWFKKMDENGILIFFFFYDDGARIWGPSNSFWKKFWHKLSDSYDSVPQAERDFIVTLVNKFEHHENLIWVVAEEYQEAFTETRISNIAKVIRETDDNKHVIAVHKLPGIDFSEFANDPNIDQFAIQYDADISPKSLHKAMLKAWKDAAGRYNLNMSEIPYGKSGTGQDLRRRVWAIIMGGAYVMIQKMDIVNSPVEDLEMLGRAAKFMETTDFNRMSPHDELAFSGTEYVLALPGNSYIAYSSSLGNNQVGIKGMTEGVYRFHWLDIVNGSSVIQPAVYICDGNNTWPTPNGIGSEIVVHIRRVND